MKQIEDITADLETILDSSKLDKVIQALGEICLAKADHIRTNWQDEVQARAWEVAGNKIATLAINHLITRVP